MKVFINNHNLLTWPRGMVNYLLDTPDCTPIIVDEASTYPPLLEWYENECPVQVWRNKYNSGPRGAWVEGLYRY